MLLACAVVLPGLPAGKRKPHAALSIAPSACDKCTERFGRPPNCCFTGGAWEGKCDVGGEHTWQEGHLACNQQKPTHFEARAEALHKPDAPTRFEATFEEEALQKQDAPTTHCTDIDIGKANVTSTQFGGVGFCCSVCKDDTDAICCPSRDANGPVRARPAPSHAPCVLTRLGSARWQTTMKLTADTVIAFESTEAPTDFDDVQVKEYFADNLCASLEEEEALGESQVRADVSCGEGADAECFRFDGIGAGELDVSMIVRNTTNYYPVWPTIDPDLGYLYNKKGYLFNGRKSDDKMVPDILQLNVCNNRYVKTNVCFVDKETNKPVTMKQATMRVFDMDIGKSGGPEAVQFKCTGGHFFLFGEVPKMMHSYSNAFLHEKLDSYGPNGLTAHMYRCPDDEYVTLWSHRLGCAAPDQTPSGRSDAQHADVSHL
eukprot:Transcript_5458.p1 GENE.Transcript_5458~~Transcript_5458.p1  ORF type:complete len:444 (+),score=90.30 Transcript_5458:42-1334(+)